MLLLVESTDILPQWKLPPTRYPSSPNLGELFRRRIRDESVER